MFVQLDNFFHSASGLGALIFILTTCVLIVYLIFKMTDIIDHRIQKNTTQETVVIDNKEIHIHVGNRSYEFQSRKIKFLFWKLIGISYVIGLALCFAIVFVIPLIIIVILIIRKGFKFGIFKGVRTVLRLASPK